MILPLIFFFFALDITILCICCVLIVISFKNERLICFQNIISSICFVSCLCFILCVLMCLELLVQQNFVKFPGKWETKQTKNVYVNCALKNRKMLIVDIMQYLFLLTSICLGWQIDFHRIMNGLREGNKKIYHNAMVLMKITLHFRPFVHFACLLNYHFISKLCVCGKLYWNKLKKKIVCVIWVTRGTSDLSNQEIFQRRCGQRFASKYPFSNIL